ncbi:MAG: cytochrome c1 [Caedibacter sp. 37-49]|nr:MAG: cytochrome c1 [Caedibacter sp. 37-49]
MRHRFLRDLLIILLNFFVSDEPCANQKVPVSENKWSFTKLFGTYDRAELQRGFQVYQQVCSTCHGLSHISYRHLKALGFSEAKIKAIAAQKEVQDGFDDEGNPVKRAGKPSDYFPNPFINEKAARAANNGANPPDLSLIIKARKEGPQYVKALLTGYTAPPSNVHLAPGMYYNLYFSGHQIAMAPPLSKDLVQYADGTPATVDQMAHDVVTFLAWASEPEMEERKHLGVKVLTYLLIFTVLMGLIKRRTWRRLEE